MTIPLWKLSLLLPVWANLLDSSWALIVSPRPTAGLTNPYTGTGSSQDQSLEQSFSVARIRSTRRPDVEPVADLLSSAITGDASGFKARVERLRIKSSVETTLDLRVRAIQEGKQHLSQAVATPPGEAINEKSDHLRFLWSNESFRNKIAQAAELSSEPHPWGYHNFAMAPKDPNWLRHEMITAECTRTGAIVGFCEIAMLLSPPQTAPPQSYGDSGGGNEEEEYYTTRCLPTIANLVVSPEWRRRGIAKGLIRSAERVVERKWKSDELGLYVEKRNTKAIYLYSNAGFQVQASLQEEDNPDKWYMCKELKTQ
ncbi:FR47-like protein [Seminavis robusta]|uniref:FR47-like protein n=1 Tax=Seminavis robusta TaxID=568900 RepID=A0A9N8DS13_9STRA|nr:FR47-like protein [Seminavis robusta]|eukprot:Sro311_g114320.1 FR47-like protein (313) ;mRNA; r:48402-49340